jgi:hypothetical protein
MSFGTAACATPGCGRTFRRRGSTHRYCGRCSQDRQRASNRRSADKKKKDVVWVYAQRQKQADYAARLKLEVLTRYSPNNVLGCSCPRCPITSVELLGIHHITVSGKYHRDKNGIRLVGLKLYRFLRDSGFPRGYSTMCHSCNIAAGEHKICPRAGQIH